MCCYASRISGHAMSCPSGKIEHATRDDALEAQKRLVWSNRSRGTDEKSAGLNVYPCEHCGAWHVGHSRRQTPLVYHYDHFVAHHGILYFDALVPPKPLRVHKLLKRMHSGADLQMMLDAQEVVGMTWFTWESHWDFTCLPHPGAFLFDGQMPRVSEGVLRVVAPAFVAKLRWSDYIERNNTPRGYRKFLAARGNPAQWLATDAPVPLSDFHALEIWYQGAWVSVNSLSEDELDAWVAKWPKD